VYCNRVYRTGISCTGVVLPEFILAEFVLAKIFFAVPSVAVLELQEYGFENVKLLHQRLPDGGLSACFTPTTPAVQELAKRLQALHTPHLRGQLRASDGDDWVEDILNYHATRSEVLKEKHFCLEGPT
jgi:hypothetical protein